jgi:hypothetical protein
VISVPHFLWELKGQAQQQNRFQAFSFMSLENDGLKSVSLVYVPPLSKYRFHNCQQNSEDNVEDILKLHCVLQYLMSQH